MLSLIVDRLTATLTHARWTGVAVAEDIDVLTRRASEVESGTAIVMPWRSRAQAPLDVTGGFRQLVEEQVAVGVVLRDYDHRLGGDRAVAFDAYVADLEAALAGWVPPGAPADAVLVGGESSPVTTGVSIYVQTWAFRRFLTGALT